MNLDSILKRIQDGENLLKVLEKLPLKERELLIIELRKEQIKEIIATCKENGNGKIISVEIDGQDKLETVKEVVDNYNSGQGYKIKNGQEVKPFDHDDKIRSHANNTPNDNLRNLEKSKKCKI